jgi:hypothetical protein
MKRKIKMAIKVKELSTGDNDSMEDLIDLIENLKTEDGQPIGFHEALHQIEIAINEIEEAQHAGCPNYPNCDMYGCGEY